jgi:hypothetical protein
MATYEEYLKAKAIVDEYEAEDDDDEIEDDDDYYERQQEAREEERAMIAWNCTCGAWTFNEEKTKVYHVADCICGAE